MENKTIKTLLTPQISKLFDFKGKTVIIIDIFRATSTIVTGLAHGIEAFKPVATLEECEEWGKKGYITGAERGGKQVKEFSLGNSPFAYMDKELKNKKIAFTTTNGTQAVVKSIEAKEILAGSFLNLQATVDFIRNHSNDILLFCSGWKGTVNVEDTVFAGALVEALQDMFAIEDDSSLMALELYLKVKHNLKRFLQTSPNHERRIKLKIEKDIDFCLQTDIYDMVSILQNGHFVKL